jgi:DNA-binding LacI/PurR family transcriptional regulator
VESIAEGYQASVLAGALAAAHARDSDLFCFVGGELGSPDPVTAQRNGIFGMVSRESVDALAIMAGSVGNRIGPSALRRFCERFEDLPMCSIAGDLEGLPGVVVDNREGVRHALSHLVRFHGRRRVAFIRGPSGNKDADERFAAYAEGLDELGIPLDERLIAPGDYSTASGIAAVKTFFDERGLQAADISALMTADDYTALGALEELARRNISVPGQIAVIGFDDIEEARYCSPPLTTIRQPLREQGEASVNLLLNLLRGGNARRVVLPTRVIYRRSCGCFARDVYVETRDTASGAPKTFESELLRRREVLRAELARASGGSSVGAKSGWEDLLITSFARQLRTGSTWFHDTLAKMLDTMLQSGGDLAAVQGVITLLRSTILACLEHESELRARAEDILHDARLAVVAANQCMHIQFVARAERLTAALRMVSRCLVTTLSVEEVEDVICQQLPALGVECCYVSLLEESEAERGLARLAIVHDEVGRPPLDVKTHRFPIGQLVPRMSSSVAEARAFFVFSLHFASDLAGVLLLSGDDVPGYVHETLANVLGPTVLAAGARKSKR